ncbi:hypothetical protein [Kribbella sancticallisti]|uniref:hypothetical protein n=1 Tax=Kribbella sancticallisti TaxID=460087 RepID=UPI0031CDC928
MSDLIVHRAGREHPIQPIPYCAHPLEVVADQPERRPGGVPELARAAGRGSAADGGDRLSWVSDQLGLR